MKMRYLSLAFLFSFASFAQSVKLDPLAIANVETLKCPSVNEDFSRVLTKLATLKSAIKKDANCRELSNRMRDVEKLSLDRNRFVELVTKAKSETLTEREVKDISSYVENATLRVGNLIELISNSGGCFEDDKKDQTLTLLSGFVSEATGLLSQISGPWGAPIAMGGQILSTFITSLDKVMKNHAGYDFRQRDQWTAYVQNLCTYQNLRAEINTLLHPQEHLDTLRELQQKLNVNQLTVQNVCSSCDPDFQVMNAPRLAVLSARIQKAQDWVVNEIRRISSESNAYWNNVTGKTLLAQAQRDMENFLIDFQAAKFLDYQIGQSSKLMDALNDYLIRDARLVVQQAISASVIPREAIKPIMNGGFWGVPAIAAGPVFKALTEQDWRAVFRTKGKPNDDLGYRLMNASKQAKEKFDATLWSFGTAAVFCEFFKQAEFFSSDIQRSCNSRALKSLTDAMMGMDAGATVSAIGDRSKIRRPSWADALNVWSDQVQNSIGAVMAPGH